MRRVGVAGVPAESLKRRVNGRGQAQQSAVERGSPNMTNVAARRTRRTGRRRQRPRGKKRILAALGGHQGRDLVRTFQARDTCRCLLARSRTSSKPAPKVDDAPPMDPTAGSRPSGPRGQPPLLPADRNTMRPAHAFGDIDSDDARRAGSGDESTHLHPADRGVCPLPEVALDPCRALFHIGDGLQKSDPGRPDDMRS
jgi:hypothetical protein